MKLHLTQYNVTKILHEKWDPIGCGVPEDEYEHYAEIILRMLQQKNSKELIMLYMIESCNISMQMSPDIEKINNTIEQFIQYKWLK